MRLILSEDDGTVIEVWHIDNADTTDATEIRQLVDRYLPIADDDDES